MSVRTTARLLPLLPLLLLAACGGGDTTKAGSASPTPAGLTKAEFVTQAEALCTKANAEIDAQAEPASIAELGTSFSATLTIAETYTSQLEALAAKQSDKAEIDRIFLTPLRGQVTALAAFAPKVVAAAAQGEAAVDALPEPNVPDADLKAMTAYGFKACNETAANE